jgi:NAD-dependent protein deacetylase/lipoamidase
VSTSIFSAVHFNSNVVKNRAAVSPAVQGGLQQSSVPGSNDVRECLPIRLSVSGIDLPRVLGTPHSAAMSAIPRLAALLAGSARTVVFTGAGISTESGIPDFRSPGGVWSRMKPIDFGSFMRDEDARREAWQRTFSGMAGWVGAKANEGHLAIAHLVRIGKVGIVITQNVDNLHQDAGVPAHQVIELHGNAAYATCLICGLRHELADLRDPFLEQGTLPTCRACGGIVKSATISFGQPMPVEAMRRAEAASRECDLFIVLGSSLLVYPAAALPMVAKSNGAALAIVNREPTDMDGRADLVLHAEIGDVLKEIVT